MTAAALALGALLAWGRPGTMIDWQPGLAGSQVWRWWSAAWVHYSERHLLANLTGAALVAGYGWAAAVPLRRALAWLLAWPLVHLALLAQPGLQHYGGLSGVLHAGVAIVATGLVRDAGPTGPRALGVLVWLGLTAKVLSEAPWRGAVQHPPGWDIATAPGAHAAGLLVGTALALLLGSGAAPASPRTPVSAP